MRKLMLSAAVVFAVTSAFAWGEWVDGVLWYYTLVDGGGAIIQSDPQWVGGNYKGELTTPLELGGEGSMVVGIDEWAFSDCPELTSLTISEGVTNISDCAFSGCTSLAVLSLPKTLQSIGESAFDDCNSLTTINVPAGETDRIKKLIEDAGADVSKMTFVEPTPPPVPQFSAITFANGVVTLTVTNTAPYLTYGISMTNDLSKIHSTTNFVGDAKQGVGAGALTWEIPVGANPAGFFKVLPKPVFGN